MNDKNNYYNKYLKYKNKYLELKQLAGSGFSDETKLEIEPIHHILNYFICGCMVQ